MHAISASFTSSDGRRQHGFTNTADAAAQLPRNSRNRQPAACVAPLLAALTAALLLFGGIAVRAADDAKPKSGSERWEPAIQKFEQQDRETPPPKQPVLFVGSSSIRMWDLKKWFPDLPAVNRGFGGSEVSDTLHFADRIVFKYRPRDIVMYAGDNDIARGKTPQQVAADFEKFAALVREKLPQTRLLYIAIKPSIARWKLYPQMREANRLIAEICKRHERLHFVDIAAPMLADTPGPPPQSLFLKDGLHLSDAGYKIWTEKVREALR